MKKKISHYKEFFHVSEEEWLLLKEWGQTLTDAGEKQIIAEQLEQWLNKQSYFEYDRAIKVIEEEMSYIWKDVVEDPLGKKFISGQQYLAELIRNAGVDYDAHVIWLAQLYNFLAAAYRKYISSEEILKDLLIIHNKMCSVHLMVAGEAYLHHAKRSGGKADNRTIDIATPVTQLWDAILLLPLVGFVDAKRAQITMKTILSKITETQALVIILDISGVPILDMEVTNSLLKITYATKLMGCHCIISGVSPAIAETIVDLGIDSEDIDTNNSLKGALNKALRVVGMRLFKMRENA